MSSWWRTCVQLMQCNVMQSPYLSRRDKYCITQFNSFVIVSYGHVKLLCQLDLFIERITARLGHVSMSSRHYTLNIWHVRTQIMSNWLRFSHRNLRNMPNESYVATVVWRVHVSDCLSFGVTVLYKSDEYRVLYVCFVFDDYNNK